MATDTQPTLTRVRPYRLSVPQYLRMIEAGIFPDNARVELLDGILVRQMTKGTPHDFTLGALCEQLRPRLPAGWVLREDKSVQLGPQSRPEPDIAIVAGPLVSYRRQDPTARDVALIVEVANSSYADDRSNKWRLYAAAQIPVYWIVHLPKRQVEVYRDPVGTGAKAEYGVVEVFGEDAAVPIVIAGAEVGRVAVRDILS